MLRDPGEQSTRICSQSAPPCLRGRGVGGERERAGYEQVEIKNNNKKGEH